MLKEILPSATKGFSWSKDRSGAQSMTATSSNTIPASFETVNKLAKRFVLQYELWSMTELKVYEAVMRQTARTKTPPHPTFPPNVVEHRPLNRPAIVSQW